MNSLIALITSFLRSSFSLIFFLLFQNSFYMLCSWLSFKGYGFSNIFDIIFIFLEDFAMPLVIHGLKEFRTFTFIFILGKESSSRNVKVLRNSLQTRFESLDVFKLFQLFPVVAI